jgi:hypothetical protein
MKMNDRFAGALEDNHGERENTRNQQLKPTVNIPLPKPIQPRSTSPLLSLSNDPKKEGGKLVLLASARLMLPHDEERKHNAHDNDSNNYADRSVRNQCASIVSLLLRIRRHLSRFSRNKVSLSA